MQADGTTRRTLHTGRSLLIALTCLAAAHLLGACSLLQKTGLLPEDAEPVVPLAAQPYEIRLQLSASEDLNPDPRSRPSPVQVRVFLGDGQSGLARMPFDPLFSADASTASPQPVASLMLQPGQQRQLQIPANRSLTRVLIVAAFRDLHQSRWKAAADIRPQETVSIDARVGARSVTIEAQP